MIKVIRLISIQDNKATTKKKTKSGHRIALAKRRPIKENKVVKLPDNRLRFEFDTPKKNLIFHMKHRKSNDGVLKAKSLEELLDELKSRQIISGNLQRLLETFGDEIENPKSVTEDVMKFASVLYTFSHRAFDLVGEVFRLPEKAVLKFQMRVRGYKPGFTQESLTVFREKIPKTYSHRVCSIMMDFVDLKRQLGYDKRSDCWMGHVEVGGGPSPLAADDIPLASEVLIFTAAGLGHNWKLPFGYFLTQGLNGKELRNLVCEAIAVLEDCGLYVKALVCDGFANTIQMGELFGCKIHTKRYNEIVTFFRSPVECQRNISLVFGYQQAFLMLRHLLEDKWILRSPVYGVSYMFSL